MLAALVLCCYETLSVLGVMSMVMAAPAGRDDFLALNFPMNSMLF